MAQEQPDTTLIIFGGAGDLTRRKLIPALFNLYCKGRLTGQPRIIGFSIEDYDNAAYRKHLEEGVKAFSNYHEAQKWSMFAEGISYVQGDLTSSDDFVKLDKSLAANEPEEAERLYYLAISPTLFAATISNLGAANMADQSKAKRRVVIEKPFGRDFTSAQSLNEVVHKVFAEEQVYRIDHYLGKETAQNILFFRFANTVFESTWNRNYIDAVQITVAESVDVGHRAGYYDHAGVFRDMFQNHLLQLLTLIALEPPASFEADELRNEKVKVLKHVRPIDMNDTVYAQYEGYLETEGVADNSRTGTYAALRLFIDNWRWQGVPFYLRSGKSLARKATEVVIQFKRPPRSMFNLPMGGEHNPDILTLCIQPDEGIHYSFEVKSPSSTVETKFVDMEFHYDTTFGQMMLPEAYERLLLDAVTGDASLFIRSDEIEAAWRIMDPIIQGWHDSETHQLTRYEAGSWGPVEADALLSRDQFEWLLGCVH